MKKNSEKPGILDRQVDELTNEVKRDMRDIMRTDVEIGLEPHDEIVGMAVEVLADEHGCSEDDLRPLAERMLPEIVRECRREQESWPAITECDRLDAAFADLNWSGIVCRRHFTCCSSCGHKEIWEEIEAERSRERDVRGYAFYHVQSTDTAVEGGGLWLNHASVHGRNEDLQIAEEIVGSLRDHGLDVDWPEDAEKSIHVKMDWKRRVLPDGAC